MCHWNQRKPDPIRKKSKFAVERNTMGVSGKKNLRENLREGRREREKYNEREREGGRIEGRS